MYHRIDVLVDQVKDGFQFFQYCVLLFESSQFTLCLFKKQLILILIPDNLYRAFVLIVLSEIAEAPELVYGDLFFFILHPLRKSSPYCTIIHSIRKETSA